MRKKQVFFIVRKYLRCKMFPGESDNFHIFSSMHIFSYIHVHIKLKATKFPQIFKTSNWDLVTLFELYSIRDTFIKYVEKNT